MKSEPSTPDLRPPHPKGVFRFKTFEEFNEFKARYSVAETKSKEAGNKLSRGAADKGATAR